MAELKTKAPKASVKEFLNKVEPEEKRRDSFALLEMFENITGEKAVMWGDTIVGFGQYHYKSERSRQEGDWMLVGFSPRKQNLTLYVLHGNQENPALGRILLAVYVISGTLAALGGAVEIAQLGAVSPTFGREREFAAVAAAVLGGVSLFGGRGSVLPGVLLGTFLVQTVENGLVIVNADPYLYPLVMACVIFLAVLLDSARRRVR